MRNQKVFIILSDTGTLFTKMIKQYTKSPYNHASISFDSTFHEVYSFGRKNMNNPFIGGFVKENLKSGVFKEAHCTIYSCSITDYQLKRMKSFIQKIEDNKHLYRYNLIGLFGIMVNKQINRQHAFFCSQFVATVLTESNVTQFEKPTAFIQPYDLVKGMNFRMEYEGKIIDLYQEAEVCNRRKYAL